MEQITVYASPLGPMYIGVSNNTIVRCDWKEPTAETVYELQETALGRDVRIMLDEYFRGERESFDLPLAEPRTAFAKAVMEALGAVAYGTTVSYSELAVKAGKELKYARAVAQVMATNLISILRPCHRVVGINRSIADPGGYRGGSKVKSGLLMLEKEHRHS